MFIEIENNSEEKEILKNSCNNTKTKYNILIIKCNKQKTEREIIRIEDIFYLMEQLNDKIKELEKEIEYLSSDDDFDYDIITRG